MIAQLELPLNVPSDETSFIPYEVRKVPADDPAVKLLRSKFFQNYNIPEEEPNPALNWFGVFTKDMTMCLLVFAIGVRPDGGVEGTDFYALPTKEGAKAVDWALKVACRIIDAGHAPFFFMWVLGRNRSMRRRVEKAFGVDGPRSVLYSYGRI